jgi:hypothetical protein
MVSTYEKLVKGWFIEQQVKEFKKYEDNSYTTRDLKIQSDEPLKLELKAFLKSITGEQDVQVTGEDGLKALEIAVKCLGR